MWRYRGRRVGPIMHLVNLLLGLIVYSRLCQCSRDTQISGEHSPDGLRVRHGLPIESKAALPDEAEATGYVNDARDYGKNETTVSLCILLIVRDEEVNLRANLPLWENVASCYVIGVDDRTTDGTVHAIREVLPEEKPRFVFFYTFKDFAQARNVVLRSASHNFPGVSHILIADADWRPRQETLDLSDLDFDHGAFQFRVWDHSGHTTRLVEWLLRNVPGLKFKYRIHETLDKSVMNNKYPKMINWEVAVVESDSSWHAKEHEHSRTAERFLFDINLLKMDYKDDPTDLHTLFYLGITTYSYMETLIGKGTHERTPELQKLIDDGTYYLTQAVDIHGDQGGLEFVWSSIRWLAYGYHYFVGDSEEAKKWYQKCVDYDVTRVDCEAFLSRLYLDIGDLDSAWDRAKVGLLYRNPMHRPIDFFYVFECFIPMQAAKVISERIMAESLGEDSLDGVLTLGWYLLLHHRDHCNHGVLVDTQHDVDNLESWFKDTIEREGVDVAEIKRLALLSPERSLLSMLLDKWGTGSSVLRR